MSQMSRSRGSLASLQTQSDHRNCVFYHLCFCLTHCPYKPLQFFTQWQASGTWVKYTTEQEQQQVVSSHSWDSSQKNWGMARIYVGKSPSVSPTLLMLRKSLWKLAENIVSLLDDDTILWVAWMHSFFGRQLSHGFLSPPLIAFCLCKGIFAICCSDLIRAMQRP